MPGVAFSSIPVTQVFRRYTESKRRWKCVLLFFQFGGTAFLVGMMCIVFAQYHYILSKDMGYDTGRVAYSYYFKDNVGNAMSNVRNLPYVEAVASSEFDVMESRSPYPVNDAQEDITSALLRLQNSSACYRKALERKMEGEKNELMA